MCNNLISTHQNSARGKQLAQLALLKYSHFFLALRYEVSTPFLLLESTKVDSMMIVCEGNTLSKFDNNRVIIGQSKDDMGLVGVFNAWSQWVLSLVAVSGWWIYLIIL